MKQFVGLIILVFILFAGVIQSESEDKMPNIPQVKIGNTTYNIKDYRVDDLESALSETELGNGVYNGYLRIHLQPSNLVNKAINSSTGELSSNSDARVATLNKIKIINRMPIYIEYDTSVYSIPNLFLFSNNSYVGSKTYTKGERYDCDEIRILFYKRNSSQSITPSEVATGFVAYQMDLGAPGSFSGDARNLLFESKRVQQHYYDGAQDVDYSSVGYDYFIVPVVSGTTYYISPFRRLDKNGAVIVNETQTNEYEYTADFTGNVYVTFIINTPGWYFTAYSGDRSNVKRYDTPSFFKQGLAQQTGTSQTIPMSQKAVTDALNASTTGSILFDKKWVACGDSFTEGDFNGLTTNEYIFSEGIYQGQKKVYPFYIGNRTGAEVINEAKAGSTMAYIDGSRNEFSTPNGRYTQIPSDADYITLYFGINDSHQHVPIGTIDDAVNTTFYGAWNIVMAYLIENYPKAKIGIIISNGCETIDYPNAEIAIAKKWGVSYLDINGDPKIPLVYRTNGKPDLCQTVINLRTVQYRVSPTNAHPNPACHEDESTYIQSWLESI